MSKYVADFYIPYTFRFVATYDCNSHSVLTNCLWNGQKKRLSSDSQTSLFVQSSSIYTLTDLNNPEAQRSLTVRNVVILFSLNITWPWGKHVKVFTFIKVGISFHYLSLVDLSFLNLSIKVDSLCIIVISFWSTKTFVLLQFFVWSFWWKIDRNTVMRRVISVFTLMLY